MSRKLIVKLFLNFFANIFNVKSDPKYVGRPLRTRSRRPHHQLWTLRQTIVFCKGKLKKMQFRMWFLHNMGSAKKKEILKNRNICEGSLTLSGWQISLEYLWNTPCTTQQGEIIFVDTPLLGWWQCNNWLSKWFTRRDSLLHCYQPSKGVLKNPVVNKEICRPERLRKTKKCWKYTFELLLKSSQFHFFYVVCLLSLHLNLF